MLGAEGIRGGASFDLALTVAWNIPCSASMATFSIPLLLFIQLSLIVRISYPKNLSKPGCIHSFSEMGKRNGKTIRDRRMVRSGGRPAEPDQAYWSRHALRVVTYFKKRVVCLHSVLLT
jgi:hypothetical protein